MLSTTAILIARPHETNQVVGENPMNTLYPVFLKLHHRPVLVVGGGAVAEQKINGLLQCQAAVTVLAPEVTASIERLAAQREVTLLRRNYRRGDVGGFFLVIGATDDPKVQAQIVEDAERASIPVNIVDVPERCSFYLGSVFQKGDLKVAVSTNGKSPTLGKFIRDRISEEFSHGYPELLEQLGRIRPDVLSSFETPAQRKEVFERIFATELQCMKSGKLFSGKSEPHRASHKGRVALVGAGPGDPDLISVKGLRFLERADVLFYDALVNRELLARAPRSAEKIFVGKRGGQHSMPQSEINCLMIEKAREGKDVVRLKGGDPFIFGRGGEELEALREAGIDVEIVPGITAGTGVPASLGLPLTYRHISSSVVFVTGHECSNKERPINWKSIASIDTIVIYMGVRNLAAIVERLREAGRSSDTPVAVIFAGTYPEEVVLHGTLATISKQLECGTRDLPGLIIVGDVAGLFQSRLMKQQETPALPERGVQWQ